MISFKKPGGLLGEQPLKAVKDSKSVDQLRLSRPTSKLLPGCCATDGGMKASA